MHNPELDGFDDLAAAVRHWSRIQPDKLLYRFCDATGRITDEYTYGEFDRTTRAAASMLLTHHQLKPGDRALLVYQPGLDFIVAFFACMRAGILSVPVYSPAPIDTDGGLERLDVIRRDSGAKVGLTSESLLGTIGATNTRYARRGLTPSKFRWVSTDRVPENGNLTIPDNPNPVLFLQYTSGSTGCPKGVVVTHRNVIANGNAFNACLETVRAPKVVSWLPQYHDMGLIGCYLHPMISGGTTYGFSPFAFLRNPALWFRLMSDIRADMTAAPNFAYQLCLREDKIGQVDLEGVDLSCISVMASAGEPVRANTYERFIEHYSRYGLRPGVHCGAYGLAENTLIVSFFGKRTLTVNKRYLQEGWVHLERFKPESNNQVRLVSCGKPLPGTKVRIVDPDLGRSLGDLKIGEIWVDSEARSYGYWRRPDLTKEVFEQALSGGNDQRFLRTGDLGILHEDELFILGRKKDLIIIRGVNYYPQDIEAVVESALPQIRRGCTVAFSEDVDGVETLTVLVEVNKTDDFLDPAEIVRVIRSRYFVTPRTVALVARGSVVKTTSGKIARRPTQQAWAAGALTSLAVFTSEREVLPAETGLRARFGRVLRLHGLSGGEDRTFADLGADSLMLVEILTELEAALQEHGWSSIAEAVDGRLLSEVTIGEFFGLLDAIEKSSGDRETMTRELIETFSEEREARECSAMVADAKLTLPHPERSRTSPEPRGVLLTGGTGFLGPFLLRSLLEETEDDVYVLVRATDKFHGADRMQASLRRARLWTPELQGLVERRVHTVCGDLSLESIGLDLERWRELAERTHVICHNGAEVNYIKNYAGLRRTNVEGTRELLKIAFAGQRKDFHFISSTFIFGWTVRPVLFEVDHNSEMDGLDFGYAQTKWVAEQLVWAAALKGLGVRIYRPSLISPSLARYGSVSDIAIRLLAFMIRAGIAVEAGNQFSLLPVDVVASSIVAILARRPVEGDALHVTADYHYSLADVTRLITRLYGYNFDYFGITDFVDRLIRLATPKDPVFPLLDFFSRSSEKIEAMQAKRYDNSRYREERRLAGLHRDQQTLERVVTSLVGFMIEARLVPDPPIRDTVDPDEVAAGTIR